MKPSQRSINIPFVLPRLSALVLRGEIIVTTYFKPKIHEGDYLKEKSENKPGLC